MPAPLAVFADLDVDVGGESVHISAEGDTVDVDLPSLRVSNRLFSVHPFFANRREALRDVHEALGAAGLTANVRLRGETIARLGTRARPSSFARLLGSRIEVRPGLPIRQATRRRPGLWIAAAASALALATLLIYQARR